MKRQGVGPAVLLLLPKEKDVTLRKRVFAALAISISAAVVLLMVGRASDSKVLFVPQLPGFWLFSVLWGIHSGKGNSLCGLIVFRAANAVVYWPIAFGLSFLCAKPSK